MDKIAFGRRLYTLRREQDLSSEALSELCGMNAVFIRQIENASRLPSLPVLAKLCNATKILPNYLLQDSLTWDEEERIDAAKRKMLARTPRQLDMILAMIDTMCEEYDADSK